MSSKKDAQLYQQRAHNLNNGKEISSSTTLSFTSQLSSLISSNSTASKTKPTSSRNKPKKDDIFTRPNRNTAKRAKRDDEDSPHFEQKHTTNGEALDRGLWERSKRKMEEKARLYAAMKRGDVEDDDAKYAVDFDQKWANKQDGKEEDDDDDDDAGSDGDDELVEFTDEFGRTRKGTRAQIARAKRAEQSKADLAGDRFAARPAAPSNVIYGDAIQHQAFDPDAPLAAQMEALAKKRDKSLTPPPEEHFDSTKEVRTKGTGFYQFSGTDAERRQQMEGLESERKETERIRDERQKTLDERRQQIEQRRKELQTKRSKRKADEFLEEIGIGSSNS